MKARNGFALITVLWLIAMLSVGVSLALSTSRLGQQATLNRVWLTRARWAAEACAAIAAARWQQPAWSDTATIDLGRTTRCRWDIEDPTARVNVNSVSRDILARLVGDSLAESMIDQRAREPFLSDSQLSGFDELLTVDGPGTINANGASERILLALPGLGSEAVARLWSSRAINRPIVSLDELAGSLSPPGRSMLLGHYADLARILTFSSPQLRIVARGWVAANQGPVALVATIELLAVPLPERFAVIRRRMRT